MNTLPLRPNVCMLVFNSELKLFLGERAGCPGIWQFPQGGVEDNTDLASSVIRELHEELGAEPESFSIVRQMRAKHEYEWDTPPEYFKGKWCGQSQTFWLVKFLGEDKEINLQRFHPEFQQWKWCTPNEIKMLAEPKRLPGYTVPLREFEDFTVVQREKIGRA